MAENKGTRHVSQPITKAVWDYKAPDHIWSGILPAVPVKQKDDTYYLFGSEAFRYHNKITANGTEAPRVKSYSASTDTYSCKTHAYKDVVTDEDMNDADAPIKPKIRTARNLLKIVDNDIEIGVADTVFAAGNYAVGYKETVAAADRWNVDVATGQPLVDVDEAKSTIQTAVGAGDNDMIMVVGKEVDDQIKRHPDLLDMYKYTGVPILNNMQIAQAFGVRKYIVGGANYVSSKPGQTETFAKVWGKFCAILTVPVEGAIDTPSWGYTFLYQLYGGLTAKVKDWRDEAVDGNWVQSARAFDIKVTGKNAGFLFSTVVN